jgi:hypothetical protein
LLCFGRKQECCLQVVAKLNVIHPTSLLRDTNDILLSILD